MDFQDFSYKSHQQTKHNEVIAETWKREDTVDYWRHLRMYRCLDPILKAYPQTKWLTVGDGRYGTDAHYISQFGVEVTASDINDECLQVAQKTGFIKTYKVENAEKMSFANEQFDFVVCKESYHHFPRPMLALYEMLRVAKTGIILIEPADPSIVDPYKLGRSSSLFWMIFSLKQWVKRKIGKKMAETTNRYESLGNYVYSISEREIEKVALGLNFDAIATKGLNDYYLEGVEFEQLKQNGPLQKKIKYHLERLDRQSAKRPETFGLLTAVIFKKMPVATCRDLLMADGYNVRILEKNPYANNL